MEIDTLNELTTAFSFLLSGWASSHKEELSSIEFNDLCDYITDNIVEVISDEVTAFKFEKGGE